MTMNVFSGVFIFILMWLPFCDTTLKPALSRALITLCADRMGMTVINYLKSGGKDRINLYYRSFLILQIKFYGFLKVANGFLHILSLTGYIQFRTP
jgi:hypothetical protein